VTQRGGVRHVGRVFDAKRSVGFWREWEGSSRTTSSKAQPFRAGSLEGRAGSLEERGPLAFEPQALIQEFRHRPASCGGRSSRSWSFLFVAPVVVRGREEWRVALAHPRRENSKLSAERPGRARPFNLQRQIHGFEFEIPRYFRNVPSPNAGVRAEFASWPLYSPTKRALRPLLIETNSISVIGFPNKAFQHL